MSITAPRSDATHEVFNQVPPLENRNLFLDNAPLVEALEREGGGWAHDRAVEAGAFWGGEAQEWGRLANENPPVLKTHDAVGNRVDEVEFHPAWHQLMEAGKRWDMHGLPWNEPQPGAHVARAAIYMSGMQAEAGFCCPITMTFAAVPALGGLGVGAAAVVARTYDGSLRPADKAGATCGMAMTEKQGGSDVRANTTVAVPLGVEGEYSLTGHKWFCSAPMCDVFLTLAQTDEGVTCFVLPRFLPGRDEERRVPAAAAEGQARQQVQRVVGGGVPRGVGAAPRRPGARRADDHRDGQPHAAGLRDRHGGGYARGGRACDLAHGAPQRVRQAAGRPAADAQRAGRPGDRGRGGDRAGDAPRARL